MATEHEKDVIHSFDTLISELTYQKVVSPVPKKEAKVNIEAANSHDLENKQDKTPVMHAYDLGGWTCF